MIHVGGRFEGEGESKQYAAGEQICWTVESEAINESALLCFLGDFGFVNIDKIFLLVPGKTIVDGLLLLTLEQDAPYNAMVAIVGGTGSCHIYVEHAPGEVTRDGVEHSTNTKIGADSEEEDEVIEVDCLSDYDDDDDDDEVLAARSKRKLFIANRGTYPIEGFNVDVEDIFDGNQEESRNKKNAGGVDIENEFSSYEGSFFTGSSKEESGEVRPMRRKKTTDHFDHNSSPPHICIGMVFDSRDQFKDAMTKYSVSNRHELKMTLNDKRRVEYKCKSEGCSFAIFASIDRRTNEFIVRTFKDSHGQYCRPSFSNCRVTYKVLGKHFLSRLRIMPKMLAIDIKRLAKEELLLDVTYSQCRRAKEWALNWISGRLETSILVFFCKGCYYWSSYFVKVAIGGPPIL